MLTVIQKVNNEPGRRRRRERGRERGEERGEREAGHNPESSHFHSSSASSLRLLLLSSSSSKGLTIVDFSPQIK